MNETPAWVDWFGQLVGKINEDRLRNLDKEDGPDGGNKNNDPFSFIFHFVKTFDNESKHENQVSDVFKIDYPDDCSIPKLIESGPFRQDGEKDPKYLDNTKLLWELFRDARHDIKAIKAGNFSKVLDIHGVGPSMLTQGLFFINPKDFLLINKKTLSWNREFKFPCIKKADKQIRHDNQGLKNYKSLLNKFKSASEGRPFYEIYEECVNNKSSRITKQKKQKKTSKEDKSMTHPLNQILYGPPGTGKTWNAVNHALAIIEDKDLDELEEECLADKGKGRGLVKQRFDALKDKGQIEMVTFHQNFTYEDFIEGIRPVLDDAADDSSNVHYEIVDGVFKTIADRAKKNLAQPGQDKKYVLIIDEINRGNIAKIFGELITLIEESKRIGEPDATTLALPCSSNSGDEEGGFGVPNNLYIIGTMNTADRSIALLDTALRRRFDFIEMMPEPDHPLISDNVDGVDCQQLLSEMNQRITVLLDREHQIGHSYLIDINSMESLAYIFKNRIIPLLEEYFYDDREKISQVLYNNKFVTREKINAKLFHNIEFIDTDKMIYELIKPDSPEWLDPKNYQVIYQPKTQAEATEATDTTDAT